MSKADFDHTEDTSFSEQSFSYRDAATVNGQVFVTDHQGTTPEVIKQFAESYGFTRHTDILTKAHLLLQGETPLSQIPGITEHEVLALQNETERRWHQPKLLYFTVLVCSIGAMEQGWAQTNMNGANLYFPKALGIDSRSQHDIFVVGLINSAIYLSTGLVGAWSSDPINNQIGRRGAVAVGGTLCLVANLCSSVSQTWPQLLVSRFGLGLGLGINASTVSVYAAECTPATIRGGLAVSWQMWIAFGIFIGFVANALVYDYGDYAWRLQLGAASIPALPLVLLIYLCPESPSWYIKSKGRYRLAFNSLCQLRNTELQAARDLYAAYLQQTNKSKFAGKTGPSFLRKVVELVTIPRNRRASIASYTLMLSQQLCGINIIAFYSSTIFAESGFSTYGALLASCVFGFVNFIGAFPAVWTMDTWGRRSLLLLTLPLMAITMSAAGFSFFIPNNNRAHLVALASMIYLFCAEYSPGMGPVPPAYSAEAFPLSHREVGMSMSIATANFWAAILSITFPRLLSAWGSSAVFELYAGLNLLALVLVFLFVPETRMKTLDELDEVFSVPTRRFVRYQVTEWLPWMVRRYVLGRKDVELRPLDAGVGAVYTVLGQEEDEELSRVDTADEVRG